MRKVCSFIFLLFLNLLSGCALFSSLPDGDPPVQIVEKFKKLEVYTPEAAVNEMITAASIKGLTLFPAGDRRLSVFTVENSGEPDAYTMKVYNALIADRVFLRGAENDLRLSSKYDVLPGKQIVWTLAFITSRGETLWMKSLKIKKYEKK